MMPRDARANDDPGARSYAAQISILLDRSRPENLAHQIAGQIREGIEAGRIVAGTRLPSSRRLCEQLNVARNTIVRAYEMLEDAGVTETRPASGIFARRPPRRADVPAMPTQELPANPAAMPMPAVPLRVQRLVNDGAGRLSFDFYPGRPDHTLFPIKTWRRLIQSTLSRGAAPGLVQYSDPAGLLTLRSAIASHLSAWRGIAPDPGRVVIVNGIQEGLSIAARLFLGPDRTAVLENPSYQGASFAFEATGAAIQRVPVDEDGMMVEQLAAGPIALAYVTPSHQYPTGATLSLERRHALVGWARRNGAYVVEDDYDSDFQYEGSPLPPIAALAPDCTIYFGTFSKSLGAGLRLGYIVVPPALVDAAIAVKTLLNNGSSWLEQTVLAEFIRSGGFVAHLLRTRARYRESRDVTLSVLRRHFGDVEVSGEASGLHLCWQLPSGVPAAATLEVMARKARVGVYLTAALAEIGGSVGVQLIKPDATLRDYFVTGGSGGGTTAWMRGEIQIPVTNGVSINMTLRLGGMATCEHNGNFSFGGQLIRGGTTVATRNLDAVTSNVAPPQGSHGGVVEWWALADACFGPAGAVTAFYIGDGTTNNRVVVNLTSANVIQVRYLVGNVVVAQCDLGSTGGQRPGAVAWTLTPTELRASFNGCPQVVASHASPIPTWTETRFGANPGSIFGASVLKRVTLFNREITTEAELRALAFRDPMNFAITPGDSLSYGWMGSEWETNGQSVRNSAAYGGQLGLARGGGWRQPGQTAGSAYVINLGVFGDTSTQIKTRLLAIGYDQRSKYCLIWAGQNNVNAPATVMADVAAMVAFCVSLGMDYRVMSPIYRVATTTSDRNNIIDIRNQQAALYGAKWIDQLAIWLPYADPVLDAAAIAIGAFPDTLQIPDGHPNSRAYQILGQAINALLP